VPDTRDDDRTDPVLKHSRREAIVIGLTWLAATAYTCGYCSLFGYRRPGRMLDVADIHPLFGVPSWVVWGVFAPWLACAVFTFWFGLAFMTDDDLGQDHAQELDRDIREGGTHE
jgi:hypothetical protein